MREILTNLCKCYSLFEHFLPFYVQEELIGQLNDIIIWEFKVR